LIVRLASPEVNTEGRMAGKLGEPRIRDERVNKKVKKEGLIRRT
jgi:hypothetical protein